ncbi:MAG TPA: DUF3187 family protein [Woeseiaceae bacterium]|nr:DUF3187 family protein [Woeseiaceae bacterium]
MTHCVGKSGRRSNGVGAITALAACAALHPAGATELDVRHGGPLTGLFGLPSPGESAALAPDESWRLDLLVQGSSHAISEADAGEELLLDGETWRTALRLRARFRERWEFGVEVPWLRHSGGSLDGLIDDWHALFGLPDGIRDQVPRDELRYAYRNPAGEVLDLTDSAGGLGDIRLSAGYRLRQDATGSLSLRAAVELPTGDEDELTGNGAADYSLGISWERDTTDRSGRWSAHVMAGVIRFGGTDLPAIATREFGGWAQAGVGWRLTPRIELLGQLQAASSPIDSGLDAWGGGLMLGLGAGIDIGRHYRLQLGFTEDIDVETSPDITFMLRLGRR